MARYPWGGVETGRQRAARLAQDGRNGRPRYPSARQETGRHGGRCSADERETIMTMTKKDEVPNLRHFAKAE